MKRIKVDVDGYTSGAEFIQKLQQSERYDLLFLDIELGDSSGIILQKHAGRSIQAGQALLSEKVQAPLCWRQKNMLWHAVRRYMLYLKDGGTIQMLTILLR